MDDLGRLVAEQYPWIYGVLAALFTVISTAIGWFYRAHGKAWIEAFVRSLNAKAEVVEEQAKAIPKQAAALDRMADNLFLVTITNQNLVAQQSQNLVVLIIEDNRDDAALLQMRLRHLFRTYKLEAAWARDMNEAGAQIAGCQVVIADLNLPGSNWRDVLNFLELYRKPFLLYTGLQDDDVEAEARRMGVKVVRKSADHVEISHELEKIIRQLQTPPLTGPSSDRDAARGA